MTETTARARRFAAFAALVVALLIPFVAAVVAAAPAHAAPCETCPPGGGGDPTPWTSTITVIPPAVGTVVGKSGDTQVINCSAGGGPCSVADTLYAIDRPTSGWPTYTFSYTGATGYGVTWAGACAGNAGCSVTNDQDDTSLTATSYDWQAPSVSIGAPARVGPNTVITANASDNAGIARLGWALCQPDGSSCVDLDNAGAWLTLGNRTAGDYLVKVAATDTSGNQSFASQNITYIDALHMTSSDLPAYTDQPSFTFTSDDEAHIVTRHCRAYPTGGAVSDWGPCTSDTSYAPTLADGNWTLQAVEIDDVGNGGPVIKETIVDTIAPSVSFVDGPSEGSTVATPTVQVGFTATDANLQSVTCALDDATPTACTSPQTLSGYGDGTHKYTVTATDLAGHSTSVVRDFAVNVPTALTPYRATSTYGTAAWLVARVSPGSATGSVKFVAGTKTLCKATVTSGVAMCSARAALTAGTRTVTARYHGNYAPSSTKFKLVIRKAATAVNASAPSSIKRGKMLTVAASNLPSHATGTVTVSNGTKLLCTATVQNAAASCAFPATMTAGSHTLTVRYSGDTNYAASTKTINVTVV